MKKSDAHCPKSTKTKRGTNMQRVNLPPAVRIVLYVLAAVGTPITSYLLAKGIIGELEVSLWSGLVTAITAMAALNVKTPVETEGEG